MQNAAALIREQAQMIERLRAEITALTGKAPGRAA